jgi:hypothetical protein
MMLFPLALLVPAVTVGSGVAFLLLRLRFLRPASVAFVDVESAELWRELRGQRLCLLLTSSLADARHDLLRGRLAAAFPKTRFAVVHFGRDKDFATPMVWVNRSDYGYTVEVGYERCLAAVMMRLLTDLDPVVALTIGDVRPDPPAQLWSRFLLTLDGPPWFVLCSVMRATTHEY